MEQQTILLSMTADTAQVAEKVTTYNRAEIEETLARLTIQMKKDVEELPKLKAQVEELETRIQANSYIIDLYGALSDAFNRQYPKTPDAEKPAEQDIPASPTAPVPPVVPDSFAQTTPTEEIIEGDVSSTGVAEADTDSANADSSTPADNEGTTE